MTSSQPRRVIVFVDFDGTAAEEIASNRLLERFAEGDWQQFDRQFDAGKISFRDCVVKQFSLLAGTRTQMIEFARSELRLRAGFKEFVEYCRSRHHEIHILSEALDFMIHAILEREGLDDLPVYCDRAIFNDDQLVRIELPHFREDCACRVGNCKGAHVEALRDRFDFMIYIGDGSNDLCPARRTDLIFGRRRLEEICKAQGIEYHPFEDFYEVTRGLRALGL
jgi:2-hydroxy-3-keto-5-methylthiopentenyl-1-phosphate phosphatase